MSRARRTFVTAAASVTRRGVPERRANLRHAFAVFPRASFAVDSLVLPV